jgi:hypothetical protein
MKNFAQGRGGWEKNRGHMADIPRIIFSTQRRDWAKEPFMDGHMLAQPIPA